MATLKILDSRSWRARKQIDRWLERGEALLDNRSLAQAGKIVAQVRRQGDRGLLRCVERYDGVRVREVAQLRCHPGRDGLDRSVLSAGFEAALERAIPAIERYHQHQVRPGFVLIEHGVELEALRQPLRRVGIYVPGGRASSPSTVLMTVIPARLAGVEQIVVVTPRPAWEASPALRITLARLGVREVWGIGGAHAVAALAYGTDTIEQVDKIVGPGDRWVTAAKYLVSTDVGIDGLAGPSEVVIVATAEADPAWVAADLLAQAEHDPDALAVLLTDDRRLAHAVAVEVDRQLPALATAEAARAALKKQGLGLLVDDMEEALALVESLAPEHLQLVGGAAEALAGRVYSAGAIFVGASTPAVFGDYLAGPSHVLPTGGSARWASVLGVEDFIRRSHRVRFDRAAAARSAAAAAVLADAEELPARAAAARRRLGGGPLR